MYPITSSIKALFDNESRQVLRITGTDKNGVAINITDANVVLGSFNIDRFSCNGTKLEIGTAIASEMTLKLDNHGGAFNGIVFEGMELFVEIGISDWTQDNPTVNWIPCGYFTPDEQPRTANQITLHALDRMMRFDAVPPTQTPWTDENGNIMTDGRGNIIYFIAELSFPCSVANMVQQVCARCSVPIGQALSTLPNYDYIINAMPVLQQQITFRNLIQWCAGIMGTNAWIDWTGSLRFSWYGATTGYTSTPANRFSSDLHEDDITITGVQYTNTQNVTIVSGADDYAIDMTGNYLAAVGISTILPNVKDKINGFTYRPFTASVINAPYLWPMDMITFVKDGESHTCAVTNVNFGINGAMAIEGKGETAQTNSGTAPSGVTKDTALMIEGATEAAAEKAVDSMTQEQIFNKLTNNGEVQGLLLYNDKVYLNAEYISTGFLSADRLAANSIAVAKLTGLVSGGLNNSWVLNLTDGTFTIGNISADNVTTGTLNADRIAANSIAVSKLTGSISATATGGFNAWNIDLTNGTLTIGDINASSIKAGTMSANRISGGSIDASDVTITNLSASNITSGTLNTNVIAANSIAVSKLTGAIHGGINSSWGIDLDNSTMTIGNISADNIITGTMSANRISGGTIDGTNVNVTNLSASNIKSGTLDCDDITVTNLKATSISGIGTAPVTGSFTTYRYIESAGLEIEQSATMTITNGIITGLTGYT